MERSQGFTLVEMMIVVAIIGVLAAIAAPSYRDYTARAQIGEAVQLLGGARKPLTEHYVNNGAWPATVTDLVGQTDGKYTASLSLTAGAGSPQAEATLTVTLRTTGVAPPLRGKTLALSTVDGGATWTCHSGEISGEFLPATCRQL